jgi:hypothetical protein
MSASRGYARHVRAWKLQDRNLVELNLQALVVRPLPMQEISHHMNGRINF